MGMLEERTKKRYQRYRIKNVLDTELDVLNEYRMSAEYEGLTFTGVEDHYFDGFVPKASYHIEVCGNKGQIERFEFYCERKYTDKWKIKQYRTER